MIPRFCSVSRNSFARVEHHNTRKLAVKYMGKSDLQKLIAETQRKMEAAAKDLDFLQAARYRDEVVQRCEIGSWWRIIKSQT